VKPFQFEVTVTIAYTYSIQVRAESRALALERVNRLALTRARGDLSVPLGSDETCSLLRETLAGWNVDWSADPSTD
jgi:hypothetical protein